MSRLVSLIIGNPMVILWIVLGSFAAGAASGGSLTWWVQGLRITAAEQKHTQYVQDQTRIQQEAKDAADQQRERAARDYAHLSEILSGEIDRGVVYERCVAAGKCGARTRVVRVPVESGCSAGIRLPAAVGTDETGTDAVSGGSGTAEEDAVVGECAVTTLMLNQLQTDIERQPGYFK